MSSILEKEEDVLAQAAVNQTKEKSIKCFKLFFHGVQLNIRTNNSYINNSIRNILYLNGSSDKPAHYDFELHEVSFLQGIYPHIKFSKKGDYQTIITDHDETFYWKSNRFQFVSKISRKEKRAVFYIKSAHFMRSDALIECALLYPLIFLMRSEGSYFVHSAAVAGKNGAVMISGPTLSGKTTLSLMLVQEKYRLLSDEANVLSVKNGTVYIKGFPIKPKIKEINLPKFPVLIKHRSCLIEAEKQKFFFPLSVLKQNSRSTSSSPLSLIIRPQYQLSGKLKISKMSYSELFKLISDTNMYSKFGINSGDRLNYVLLSRLLYRDILAYNCQYSDDSTEDLVEFIGEQLENFEIIRGTETDQRVKVSMVL